ncbi:MAG: hypothetical protein WKG07_02080 [Hymenobacter sp.]
MTPNTAQDSITEQFTLSARHLYATDSFYGGQQVFPLDTIANTQMRAPRRGHRLFRPGIGPG